MEANRLNRLYLVKYCSWDILAKSPRLRLSTHPPLYSLTSQFPIYKKAGVAFVRWIQQNYIILLFLFSPLLQALTHFSCLYATYAATTPIRRYNWNAIMQPTHIWDRNESKPVKTCIFYMSTHNIVFELDALCVLFLLFGCAVWAFSFQFIRNINLAACKHEQRGWGYSWLPLKTEYKIASLRSRTLIHHSPVVQVSKMKQSIMEWLHVCVYHQKCVSCVNHIETRNLKHRAGKI